MKLIIDWEEGDPSAVQGASTLEALAHEFDRCFQLMIRKQGPYGKAWRKQGWMGSLGRMQSKVERLRNLLWRDISMDNTDETIEDNARDLVNLTIFFIANRGQENKWGRGHGE